MNATQAHTMQRTRQRLALSANERRRAIADFSLQVSGMAHTMRNLMETDSFQTHGSGPESEAASVERERAIQYLEDAIRAVYRDTFGTELGL